MVDGETRDLGDRRYLLSPQDLAAVTEIPELVRLGVASFKIEGRLKTPEYVAGVTRVYRRAIDDACAGLGSAPTARERYELEMLFSRGQFTGWMHGVDHQRLVHGRFGKKRGALAGRVAVAGRDWVELDALPESGVRPGDGLVFDTGGDTEHEAGLPLQPALKRPLSPETLREQFGRLGETGWELRGLDCALEGSVILPLSELNRLRRELIARLETLHADSPAPPPPAEAAVDVLPRLLRAAAHPPTGEWPPTTLTVLCRSLPQIRAALGGGTGTILADFNDLRRYREAVALVREHDAGAAIFLATPRIQKAGETGFFRLIENATPDGVLVRNLGALDYFASRPELRKIGDFSLNVANPLTADLLRLAGGFERLTVSPDLNAPQVLDLLRATPPGWFEITLHQHLPMFHMEHCVFAAFLSEGKDHLTCGRPCDRHEVKLRDRVGQEHPVRADVGCRNTVFNARAQSGAEFLAAFREAGAGSFRVELLDEDRAGAERVVRLYQRLLEGMVAPGELVGQLRVNSQLGVTRGTLAVAR